VIAGSGSGFLFLQNAAEIMPRGGTISISTAWEDRYLVIKVKDNGPGIDPNDLPRIFDPFFTAKSQGSGLGLTTSHIKRCRHTPSQLLQNEPPGLFPTLTELNDYLNFPHAEHGGHGSKGSHKQKDR